MSDQTNVPQPGPMTPVTDLYLKIVKIGNLVITDGAAEAENTSLMPTLDYERLRLWNGDIVTYDGVALTDEGVPYYKFTRWVSYGNWRIEVTLTFLGSKAFFELLLPLPVAS